MNNTVRIILCLAAFLWLQPVWGSDEIAGTNEIAGTDEIARTHEECIEEPIFEGRVCTVQTNRDAKIGVVLIHGLGGSVESDWLQTIPALAENFHVIAFDLPGFGKSDKGSQHYTPTRYARLAQFLADHYLQDKPYHIVGHSMGGAIALRFAAQQPLRFQRLVLIDAAGILHPLVITKYQAGSMMERASGVEQTRGFAERLSGKLLEQVERLPISPTDIVNSALGRDNVLSGGPEKIAALALASENFSYAISSVNAPTLILWGDNDQVVPMRTGKVLAARLRQARLEIIPDSGHVPMLEQTERLNALVKNYLLANDEALVKYFQHAAPLPKFVSEREGTCSGESGKVFEGDYRSIELRNCSNIIIRNARLGQLKALNSRLSLTNTDILGKEVGLLADNSDITVTNGAISGVIAINAGNSRLDLAGVRLKGSQASVKGVNSRIIFSVSRVSSPRTNGPLHIFKRMVNEELL